MSPRVNWHFYNCALSWTSWDTSWGQNHPQIGVAQLEKRSSHEETYRCNISLGHVPATFSCVCHVVILSLLHVPADTTLIHVASVLIYTHLFVAATWPLGLPTLKALNSRRVSYSGGKRFGDIFSCIFRRFQSRFDILVYSCGQDHTGGYTVIWVKHQRDINLTLSIYF